MVSTVAGYRLYLVGLRRQLVRPNRASWLIWSAAIVIEAATYRFYVLDGNRGTRNRFAIGENQLGKAVYAAQAFGKGDLVTRFRGRRLAAHKVPRVMHGADDRFLQITPDQHLGPSGGIDDLINHSCQPNAGLRFTARGCS